MAIRKFKNFSPDIHKNAYIDDSAIVIGNVTIDEESSVWPKTVIRGDVQQVRIGARTNIQDGSIIHVTHKSDYSPGYSTTIGDDVTVGHSVIIHACNISNRVLVGMGSIILDGVEVDSDVMIGAGSLVSPGKKLESGFLYLGSPVKKIRELNDKELKFLVYSAKSYVDLKNQYLK